MARDPKRIPRILELVERLWIEAPDLRLLQLLIGYGGVDKNRDPFYHEDTTLEAHLEFNLKKEYGTPPPTESETAVPEHYDKGEHEPKKCLEAWGLCDSAYMWNVGKYLARYKDKHEDPREDLMKMRDYIDYEIERLNKLLGGKDET